MTKLPRIEDLPRTEEGYDPARVEEAFEAFGERLQSLEEKLDRLAPALRAAAPPPPALDVGDDDEDWPDARVTPAPDWVAAVPPPLARQLVLPRLALEAAFVLAVALLAGLADLSAPWIVGAVALAWALVALSEWTAAAARARWRLDEVPAPVAPAGAAGQDTDPWALPPVEATVVAMPDVSESRTVVARLPEPVPDGEPTPEPDATEPDVAPARKRRFLRR